MSPEKFFLLCASVSLWLVSSYSCCWRQWTVQANEITANTANAAASTAMRRGSPRPMVLNRSRSSCQVIGLASAAIGADTAAGIPALEGQEIAQDLHADFGEDRFGVELHALDAEFAMAQAHDGAVSGAG